MDNINIIYKNMDVLITEHIVENSDGSYTIFLNSRLTHERLLQAYKHALEHIHKQDFEKQDADAIEAIAHKR